MVVGFLGVGLVLSLGANIWLAAQAAGQEVAGALTAAASTIIVALAGLLAPQPQG
ncbi:MAG: hypothetical protein AAFX81_18725 [Pseudomonadota bacterium]